MEPEALSALAEQRHDRRAALGCPDALVIPEKGVVLAVCIKAVEKSIEHPVAQKQIVCIRALFARDKAVAAAAPDPVPARGIHAGDGVSDGAGLRRLSRARGRLRPAGAQQKGQRQKQE